MKGDSASLKQIINMLVSAKPNKAEEEKGEREREKKIKKKKEGVLDKEESDEELTKNKEEKTV